MKIALHDHENNKYPNLALMKLSAWHKVQGDKVEWFNPMEQYAKVYSAKVFTWTEVDPYLPGNTEKGGTGFDMSVTLPGNIEHICPDYSLYGLNKSYGFLTRGCPNKCDFCFVPEKEGSIRKHADIEEFLKHKEVILMDNNVLASSWGLNQIKKIVKLGLKVDFNQGLDARLIDDGIARLLSQVKWLHPVRLACDSYGQMKAVQKAVTLLRWHNCTPRRYFCYVLIRDIDDAVERLKFLKGLDIDPHAQPYRDKINTPPTPIQRHLARWANMKAEYKSQTWEEYLERKTKKADQGK